MMQALLLVPTCARPPCLSSPPGLEPPGPGRSSPQEVLGEPPLPEAPEDGQQGRSKCISTGGTTDTLSVGICFHPSFLFFFFYQISASVFVCFFVLIFSYFPLCWVLVAVHGLSLVAVSRGYSRVAMCGLLIAWLLLLQSMALGHEGFSSCSSRAQWLWHIR